MSFPGKKVTKRGWNDFLLELQRFAYLDDPAETFAVTGQFRMDLGKALRCVGQLGKRESHFSVPECRDPRDRDCFGPPHERCFILSKVSGSQEANSAARICRLNPNRAQPISLTQETVNILLLTKLGKSFDSGKLWALLCRNDADQQQPLGAPEQIRFDAGENEPVTPPVQSTGSAEAETHTRERLGRFDKLLLPSFGAHIFGLEPDASIPTMHIPPVIKGPRGLDLDYPTLLLFGKPVIDLAAKDFIENSGTPHHAQLRESLHILENENAIEYANYSVWSKGELSQRLDGLVQYNLMVPDQWYEATRSAVLGWKKTAPALTKRGEKGVAQRQWTSFGVWHYLDKHGFKLNDSEIDRVEGIFAKNWDKLTENEQRIALDVCETYLKSAYHSLLLAETAKCAAGDWCNLDHFYKRIFSLGVNATMTGLVKKQTITKEIFSLALPLRGRPYGVRDFVRDRSKIEALKFRQYVSKCADGDTAIPSNLFAEVFAQLHKFKETGPQCNRNGWITGLENSGWMAMLINPGNTSD